MSLLAPLGLLLGVALPIILALHLRRPRRRPRTVSTLRFWREAIGAATLSPTWRRPPRTLLLWLRLAIALLVTLALARLTVPWLALPGGAPPEHLVIVLDRSTAMFATDVRPARFAAASVRARALIDRAAPDSPVTLLTLGGEPLVLRSWDRSDRAPLLRAIAGAPAVGGPADFATLAPVLRASLLAGRANRVTVLWGGVASGDLPRAALDALPVQITWERFGQDSANVAVTHLAASARTPDSNQVPVFGALTNFSTQSVSVVARLNADGAEIERRPLVVPPGATVPLTLTVPQTTTVVSLHINANDALPLDDSAWAVVRGPNAVRVALVSTDPGDLARALAAQEGVALTTIAPDQYDSGARFDLTVFDRFVPAQLPAGNILLVAPSSSNKLVPVLPAAGAPRITRLDPGSPLLRGLDLSAVEFRPQPLYGQPEWAQEVAGGDGSALMLTGVREGHRVVVFAFDPRASTLPRAVAFPLLIGNVVTALQTHQAPAAAQLGQEFRATPLAGADRVDLLLPDGSTRPLPLTVGLDGIGVVSFRPSEPGAYALIERDAAGGELAQEPFAVNVSDGVSGNLLAPSGALPAGRGSTTLVHENPGGGATAAPPRELWGTLTLGAMALLLVEWWLAQGGRNPLGGSRRELAGRSARAAPGRPHG